MSSAAEPGAWRRAAGAAARLMAAGAILPLAALTMPPPSRAASASGRPVAAASPGAAGSPGTAISPGSVSQDPYLRPILKDPQGRVMKLADFRGKVRVFELWASWCGPCRMEIPMLNRIYDRYRAKGVVIVGISLDDSPADVLQFVQEVPIQYPYGMMTREAAPLFGVGTETMAIPVTFVVDREGKLRNKFVGLTGGQRLERAIAELL